MITFKDWKKEIVTVPNLLSLFRLILIPVYATLYMTAKTTGQYLGAAAVLAVSSLTDLVDGVVARKCNMISRLGIMLDPFADKMTQGVIILCLTIRNLTILPLLILFVIKEGAMLTMGCLLLKSGKMLDGALFTGKVCTTVLFVSMIALVVFPTMPKNGQIALCFICAVFMAISLVSYILCFFRRKEHIRDIEE
ncbi:MAG: CDP-alcohol phosphatidyltransferase family protein [Ruminococcaceae bacterium]|nr:CDP-alcohol phosphatidyltransferase family protein [Oscillospiraceae bacterium]